MGGLYSGSDGLADSVRRVPEDLQEVVNRRIEVPQAAVLLQAAVQHLS